MTSIAQHAAGVAVTALVTLALALSMAVDAGASVQGRAPQQQFLSLINADRRAAGLRELVPVTDVRDVALAWSEQMASERRMYHNPDFYNQYGGWRRAAENVGWATVSNMHDPSEVAAAVARLHTAFMNSMRHRAESHAPGPRPHRSGHRDTGRLLPRRREGA